jgi:hypothetical protein
MSASFSRPKLSRNGDFPASMEIVKYAEYAKTKKRQRMAAAKICSVYFAYSAVVQLTAALIPESASARVRPLPRLLPESTHPFAV